jgi:hypothetical protein
MINRFLSLLLSLILLTACEKLVVNHRFNKDEITQPTTTCPKSEVGRFQIVMGSIAVKQTYMIDTKTGRIWQWVQDTDRKNEPVFWSEEYVQGNENCGISCELFDMNYPSKEQPKK